MSNSNESPSLEERRATAMAAGKAFSKTRLLEEFRMKPAPGAQPVKEYRRPGRRRYGIYLISDCVPLGRQRPEAQQQAAPSDVWLDELEEEEI